MKKADSLLAPFIKNLGLEDSMRLGHIRKDWTEMFDGPLCFHMSPAHLKDGRLLINVDSPAWLQQLSFYKEEITKKLQRFGVKTVQLKLGRVISEQKQPAAVLKRRGITPGEQSYVEDTVSSIKDRELRDSIKRAIEKSVTNIRN